MTRSTLCLLKSTETLLRAAKCSGSMTLHTQVGLTGRLLTRNQEQAVL
jgi:hypothetical protein